MQTATKRTTKPGPPKKAESEPKPDLLGLDTPRVWDTALAYRHLGAKDQADSKRTAERRLQRLALLPAELSAATLADESGRKPVPAVLDWALGEARAKRSLVLFCQLARLPTGRDCLHANDARGARYWLPLGTEEAGVKKVRAAIAAIQAHVGKEIVVFPHGRLVGSCREMMPPARVAFALLGYPPVLAAGMEDQAAGVQRRSTPLLQRLEDESIHILREAVAEAENPALLYSVGKDSAVMLHLARKAFHPSPPPMPLLHVDTRWKFQEMYLMRDRMAHESGMKLIVHVNPEAITRDINPFDHGSALHTDITKTEGLKQALDKYSFDVVFGGARRDEEKSLAKERIFSFRTCTQRWDPENQRPELWNLYNTRKAPGEGMRVFPLSNWTELDVWQYILREGIPVVPLYFAKPRPVVARDGMLLMVDDARMRLLPGENIELRTVRFRTLGCYPLTGAVESSARTVAEIVLELAGARSSEREGRAIDRDSSCSMEKKKQAGYF